jgi:hypothetical protein
MMDTCIYYYIPSSNQPTPLDFCSTALEELSVRCNIALTQKKIVNDMDNNDDTEEFEREYLTLCAQVVSSAHRKSETKESTVRLMFDSFNFIRTYRTRSL